MNCRDGMILPRPAATLRRASVAIAILAAALPGAWLPSSTYAATTEHVSVSSSGEDAFSDSYGPAISADARFVTFYSYADNLVPEDTNYRVDVFLRDRLTGATSRVSVSSAGAQANGGSFASSVSADGRFVAFESRATNLVPGDENGASDVFVRDRLAGTTECVSVWPGGATAGGARPSISGDGRFVAFVAQGDPESQTGRRIWVRDRLQGVTERASVGLSGEEANDRVFNPVISSDGRFVAFGSAASNLVPGDDNGAWDIFLRDLVSATTERVSVSSSGEQADRGSDWPSLSADGRFVAFSSCATNLVPYHLRGEYCVTDVFVRDRIAGITEMVSLNSSGEQAEGYSAPWGSCISADGRFVAFYSYADNLVPDDTNYRADVFLRDRGTGTTQRISVGSSGEQGNMESLSSAVSADGRFVAFESLAHNLAPNDTYWNHDIFVRDVGPANPRALLIAINGGGEQACAPDVTLVFQFPDGAAEMRLSNDATDWGPWEPTAPSKPWTLSAGDGLKTVCVQCRDAQGSGSQEACDHIILDTAPPTRLSISIDGGEACTATSMVSLSLAADEAVQMRLRNDADGWSEWEWFAYTKSWNLSPGVGLRTVSFQCREACGHESAVVSDSIRRPFFEDVYCSHPLFPYVEALAWSHISGGCSTWYWTQKYCPYSLITRAQLAVMICKAAGKTALDKPTPTFSDVPATNPYYGWIERFCDDASWNGTAPGTACGAGGSGKFCPFLTASRQEIAAVLCRATGKSPMPTCSGVFADVAPDSPFCPYIERLADPASWPHNTPVTNGCGKSGGNRFYCPTRPLTRGETAVMLVRAFGIPH